MQIILTSVMFKLSEREREREREREDEKDLPKAKLTQKNRAEKERSFF